MKKIFIILLIITTGCMKYTDLGELSIIKSIGISYNESYTLYALLYDEIKKDNEPKTKVIEVNGNTITELFNNLKLISHKEIFLSHIDLLILDENLNDNNYQELIDYAISNNLRNDFLCIFGKNIKSILTNSKYNEIEDFLKSNNEIKKTIKSSFNNLMKNYLNNKSFLLSYITYENKLDYHGNYQYYHNKIEVKNEKN